MLNISIQKEYIARLCISAEIREKVSIKVYRLLSWIKISYNRYCLLEDGDINNEKNTSQ